MRNALNATHAERRPMSWTLMLPCLRTRWPLSNVATRRDEQAAWSLVFSGPQGPRRTRALLAPTHAQHAYYAATPALLAPLLEDPVHTVRTGPGERPTDGVVSVCTVARLRLETVCRRGSSRQTSANAPDRPAGDDYRPPSAPAEARAAGGFVFERETRASRAEAPSGALLRLQGGRSTAATAGVTDFFAGVRFEGRVALPPFNPRPEGGDD